MQKKNINLLQERGAPPTAWERLYDWATNTCRIIVILVNLVVIGVFVARFIIERSLNDVKEDIQVKGDVLKSQFSIEEEIRLIQAKMTSYNQLWQLSSNFTPSIKEINDYIPSDIKNLSVNMINNPKEGKIFAVSGELDRTKISRLENNLKDSENFSDVTLTVIERKDNTSDLFNFTINAKIIFSNKRESLTTNENTESTTEGTF